MNKQFWIFGGVGLLVVAAGLFFVMEGNKGARLELEGKILKVRTMAVNAKASLLIVDFRVTNTADIPYMVKAVTITLTPGSGDPQEGTPISKQDLDNVFEYQKLLGPQFNPTLVIRDKLPPRSPVDRVTAARFEMPEAELENRRGLSLRIDEIDGVTAEITEKKK
jgi:hypothetical protein